MTWYYLNNNNENCHCSQEQVEESLVGSCLDGDVSVLLKLIPITGKSYLQDKGMGVCPNSQSGMISQHLMDCHGGDMLISLQADSHAKIYQQPAVGLEYREKEVDYGVKWQGSFVRYDHKTSSWRTHQCLLLGGLELYSATWPRWGTMQDGECWELLTLVPRTKETGFGFWPTPVKNEGPGGQVLKLTDKVAIEEGYKPRYHKERKKYPEREPFNGKINPSWVEWLMGWPINWTGLKKLNYEHFEYWAKGKGWWLKDPANVAEKAIPRTVVKAKHQINRLNAIGNRQVPLVVKLAWQLLSRIK